MTRKPRRIARTLAMCAVWLAFATPGANGSARDITPRSTDQRPNILIIVADDLGYSDLGAFGGEIRTPNLDRLAGEGVKFLNFYTAPTCSPTRAMLMSGRDNHRVGLGTMVEVRTPRQTGKPGYEGYLSSQVETMAKVLSGAGYQTFMAGKWHLGMDEAHSPAALGFQQSFALLQGAANHFGADQSDAYEKIGSAARYRENGSLVRYPTGRFSTDYFTDRMIDYLRSSNPEQPFFGYLAYTAPHWPLQAPRPDIERYKGRYDAGPKALRDARITRMKSMGLIAPSIRPGRYPFTDWSRLSPGERAIEARKMEIFAAMVDHMDQNVGRLLETLRDTGRLDNLVIIFLSDNGPDGLDLRVPIDPNNPTRVLGAPVDNSLANLGNADSYTSYGPDWAHAGAAPFAGVKASMMEGGIRTPAFIWGRSIGKGKAQREAVHVLDIYPTVMRLSGAKGGDGLDGQSWASLVSRERRPTLASRTLYWELFDRRAVRDGRWKALYHPTPFPLLKSLDDRAQVRWELYDVEADPGETRDLARKHPSRLKRLVAKWEAYADRVGVVAP